MLAPLCLTPGLLSKMASFILVTIHAWRCAYCIRMQISTHKMANQFVRDRNCDYEGYVPPGYSSNGGITFASPTLFRQIYYAWASRLELCYIFKCPICGDNPEVLIGDATSESIQGKYYSGVPITEVPEDPVTAPRAHMRTDRCLLKSPASRKKLAVFAGTIASSTTSCITDTDSAEWTDLLEAVEPVHMAKLLTDINEHACKLVVHQQRHLSVMLKSMASDSPVLSYLPHAAAEPNEICHIVVQIVVSKSETKTSVASWLHQICLYTTKEYVD